MDFLKLIDKALGTNFDAPVYDPAKGRKKLVKIIDDAKRQHNDGSTRAPNRAWKAGGNNAISWAPKIGGNPVLIGGEEVNYVPAERFQEFLDGLKAAVEAGSLDKEIKAAEEGSGQASKPSKGGAGGTRTFSEQSKTNIRVSAWRRAAKPKSDKDIRAQLESEGVSKEVIDKAIARAKP